MPASAKHPPRYLLDTSAILTYLLNEPAASRVAALQHQAALPFVAIAELYAAVWLKLGQAQADEAVAAVRAWQLPWFWPTEEAVLLAGRWRAVYRLGLADSFIAALAFLSQTTLVTKDPDFRPLQPDLRLLDLHA
jgi:predicted nucleic acid-binding protein